MNKETKQQIETALDELMHKENDIKEFNSPHEISKSMEQFMIRILK